MSVSISLKSKTVAQAKTAVNALTVSQDTKNRVLADIDHLAGAGGGSILVTVAGSGNDSDTPAGNIVVSKG